MRPCAGLAGGQNALTPFARRQSSAIRRNSRGDGLERVDCVTAESSDGHTDRRPRHSKRSSRQTRPRSQWNSSYRRSELIEKVCRAVTDAPASRLACRLNLQWIHWLRGNHWWWPVCPVLPLTDAVSESQASTKATAAAYLVLLAGIAPVQLQVASVRSQARRRARFQQHWMQWRLGVLWLP